MHSSRGPLEPASPHLKSEVEIICRIAEATIGYRHSIAWQAMREDYSVIRTHISRVVPGCESYVVNVHRPGGFVMPHPPRDSRTFETTSGKAEFVASPIDVPAGARRPPGPADAPQSLAIQSRACRCVPGKPSDLPVVNPTRVDLVAPNVPVPGRSEELI